jgi:hypothetical protein
MEHQIGETGKTEGRILEILKGNMQEMENGN